MKCNEIRDLLPFYAEGEIEHDDAVSVKRHIDGCEVCRNEYLFLKDMLDMSTGILGEQATVNPDAYMASVTAKIETRKRERRSAARIFTAAAVLLTVVSAGMFVFLDGGGTGPSAVRYAMEDTDYGIHSLIEPEDLDMYDVDSMYDVVGDVEDDVLVTTLMSSDYGNLMIEDVVEVMDDSDFELVLTSLER